MSNTQNAHPSVPPGNKVSRNVHLRWGPLAAVLVAVGVYFGGQLLGGLLVSFIPLFFGWSDQRTAAWFSDSTVAQFLLVLALEAMTLLLLYWFLRVRRAGLRAVGLVRPRLRDAGYALIGFGVYLPVYIGALSVITKLIPQLDADQEQQIGFEQATAAPELMLVFISLVILPPLVEEIVVRGFLYGGLRTKLPKVTAALITSLLFAAAHLQFGSGAPPLWVAAIDTFLLSLVLIYLYERTGSLWAPIGLHALKNGVAFLVLFVFHAA